MAISKEQKVGCAMRTPAFLTLDGAWNGDSQSPLKAI